MAPNQGSGISWPEPVGLTGPLPPYSEPGQQVCSRCRRRWAKRRHWCIRIRCDCLCRRKKAG